jgi:Holliday junction resolvase
MAQTPEGKVKAKVVKQLKEMGAYYLFPTTAGYGFSGHPDIVGCYKGMFFGIECKAGKNKPTALQTLRLNEICNAGGVGWVVNKENVGQVTPMLETCAAMPPHPNNLK